MIGIFDQRYEYKDLTKQNGTHITKKNGTVYFHIHSK